MSFQPQCRSHPAYQKSKTKVLAAELQPQGVENANPGSRKTRSHHFLS